MTSLTKQDVQGVIDIANSRLTERLATRQDMQILRDCVRNLTTSLQQNQQLLRQEEYQRSQLVRRSAALETRLGAIEHELQSLRRTLLQMEQQHPGKVAERVMMAKSAGRTLRYHFNPSPAQ